MFYLLRELCYCYSQLIYRVLQKWLSTVFNFDYYEKNIQFNSIRICGVTFPKFSH